MATTSKDTRTTESHRTRERTLTRYDLLLLVIPATLLLALVASQVSPFGVSTLLGAASLVGALAVADGLFVNPPIDSNEP